MGPIELLYSSTDALLTTIQGAVTTSSMSDFVETVKWNEPFICFLILSQIILFLMTYLTRRRDGIQFFILILITMIALFAEQLNEYGRKNWPLFATQDYFDRPGLFMLVFVSGPFLALANFIVVSILFLRCIWTSQIRVKCGLTVGFPLSSFCVQVGMALRVVKLYAKKKQRQLARQRQASSTGIASQTVGEGEDKKTN